MINSNIRDKARRLFLVGMVVMLAIQPAVGGAMAATPESNPDEPDCSEVRFLIFTTEKCDTPAENMRENATWSDMYASGLAQSDLGKASRTALSNHKNDTKTIARTIIKQEVAQSLKNGSNVSVAKQNVNASLNDYYSTQQANLIRSQNANILQAHYLLNTSEQEGLDSTYLWASERGAPGNFGGSAFDRYGLGYEWKNGSLERQYHLETQNVTLEDGTNITQVYIREYNTNIDITQYWDITGKNERGGGYTEYHEGFVRKPGAEFDGESVNRSNAVRSWNGVKYYKLWTDVDSQASTMRTQGADYADKVYSTYNASEFDGLEILDPITLARNYNTDYNSTGYYGWIASELGLTSLNGNVNSSFEIAYTPRENHTVVGDQSMNGTGTRDYAFTAGNESNMSGTLYTDWDPNPNESYAFQNGTLYDTSNTSKSVYFVEQVNENKSRVVALNGTFTIESLTDVTSGESLNNTTLEQQNQATFNESTTLNEIKELLEFRNRSVENYDSGGGGGGGGFDFGNVSLLGAGIGALAALFLAISILGS